MATQSCRPSTRASGHSPSTSTTASVIGETAIQKWISSENLCYRCEDARFRNRPEAKFKTMSWTYNVEWAELQESDCQFCDVLCRAWSAAHGPPGMLTIDYGEDIILKTETGTLSVFLRRERGFFCPWRIVQSEMSSASAVGSPEHNLQILKWISQCRETHPLCSEPVTRYYPTRLIDIGCSHNDICLAETDSSTRGQYLCLSHCWGGHQPLTTRTGNLQEHLQSIAWQEIPQTYRDAICYARLLRVRYIWIDSLCIIQDDDEDWARESTSMNQVYGNAYLTIGATSAANPAMGIFGDWRSTQNVTTPIRGITIFGLPYAYAAAWDGLDDNMRHPDSAVNISDSRPWPLLDRGWAYQERILSPRFLHIGYPELRWECRQERSCECGSTEAFLSPDKKFYTRALGSGSVAKLQQGRRGLIERYSGLCLTYDTDKLPAFSGIAKQALGTAASSDYLAGLFRDSLAVDLLWHTNTLHPRKDGPASWRAPSWSWASINRQVVFPLSRDFMSSDDDPYRGEVVESFLQIHEAKCTQSTSDPTGQISDGFIRLSGLVFDCVLVEVTGADGVSSTKAHLTGHDLAINGELFLDKPTLQTQVLCLRVSIVAQVRTGADVVTEVDFALVLECVDASKKIYRRLGVLQQYLGETRLSGRSKVVRSRDPDSSTRRSAFDSGGGRLESLEII
ncbi:heterokaryon incompatibility protein-domain-containing protein [Lasiosphaeris hirsuta]|uniref:Heterokaryon incompatibility protein-domain-containing protein n=1 Tax=Lasiosphaeris hirsuta TaxID=260670 RepID=A0AA40AZ10_9PEZI|nr:heterokaryon incompatibility protein-domain-containing protein [Lasiosphaeris hirsuta]